MQRITVSLDTRPVKVPVSLRGAAHRVLMWLLALWPRALLWAYPLATAQVFYLTPTDSGVLPLSNIDEMQRDLEPFARALTTEEQLRVCLRGLQFDAVATDGWFKTYRYEPGSLRRGGFYIQ